MSHDPSEIILIFWFAAQKHLLLFLCWKQLTRIFSGFLKEIEIFYNILNVFIITFDHFNTSLLNKNTNFYNSPPPPQKKKLYWLQAFEGYSI